MEGIIISQTSDNRDTIVVDMLEDIADLLIMRIGGIATEILVMVPTFINLFIKPYRRDSYIPESTRKMRIKGRRFKRLTWAVRKTETRKQRLGSV